MTTGDVNLARFILPPRRRTRDVRRRERGALREFRPRATTKEVKMPEQSRAEQRVTSWERETFHNAKTLKSSSLLLHMASEGSSCALANLLSSPDRGVVIGGPEYEKSLASSLIDSEMAGPISMKFSEID